MGIFVSQSGNREIWKDKPSGYYSEDEWKELHPDRFYSVVGTNSCRAIAYPYEDLSENEVEVRCLPPDNFSVSTAAGEWMESAELRSEALNDLKVLKLDELNSTFTEVSESTYCMSSLGFEIDATERANRDIRGLITVMESGAVETSQFCDYHNVFHVVSISDLQTMLVEVVSNAQQLYAQKWALREQINLSENIDDLEAIEITFGEGNEQTA